MPDRLTIPKDALAVVYVTCGRALVPDDAGGITACCSRAESDIGHLTVALVARFRAVRPAAGCAGDAGRVIAASRHCEFGVAEHAGLLALWARPKNTHLAAGWVPTIVPRLRDAVDEVFGGVLVLDAAG